MRTYFFVVPIHELFQVGESSAGVILPIDDLREEDLVDVDQDGIDVETCSLRVERVAEGTWIVARTDAVDFESFNDLRARVIEA